MAFDRDAAFESWLGTLIQSYQQVQTGDLSSLIDLSAPSHAVGIGYRRGNYLVAAVAIFHGHEIPSGSAYAISTTALDDLPIPTERDSNLMPAPLACLLAQPGPEYVGRPVAPIVEDMVVELAGLAHEITLASRPGGARWRRMMCLPNCGAVLWHLVFEGNLPPPEEFRDELIRHDRRRSVGATPNNVPLVSTSGSFVGEKKGFASYCDPFIWFGEPPKRSVRERVMERSLWLGFREEMVASSLVGTTSMVVFNTGLLLAITQDVKSAGDAINQFIAAADRSGVPGCRGVPTQLLMECVGFDLDTGQRDSILSRGRNAAVQSTRLGEGLLVFRTELDSAERLLVVANQCAADSLTSELSLRFLRAKTLLNDHSHTEAFISAWMLIERVVSNRFYEYWSSQGRNKRRIKDMDWTASQQMDLLFATGSISGPQCVELHLLRKKRNEIVHDLGEADEQMAERCIENAAALLDLPKAEIALCRERL